jgi:hypothetical protein
MSPRWSSEPPGPAEAKLHRGQDPHAEPLAARPEPRTPHPPLQIESEGARPCGGYQAARGRGRDGEEADAGTKRPRGGNLKNRFLWIKKSRDEDEGIWGKPRTLGLGHARVHGRRAADGIGGRYRRRSADRVLSFAAEFAAARLGERGKRTAGSASLRLFGSYPLFHPQTGLQRPLSSPPRRLRYSPFCIWRVLTIPRGWKLSSLLVQLLTRV